VAQLCAIARRLIEAAPHIDDAEWRERIKCALVAQRLDAPMPHAISDAMDRVERARMKVRGSRPLPLPVTPEPTLKPDARPLTHDESCAALAQLRARFGPLPAMKPRAMPSGKSELMTTRERYALVSDLEQLRTIAALRRANRQELTDAPAVRADLATSGGGGRAADRRLHRA
jgi:hypothetical protein